MPARIGTALPAPRPDRPTLETVLAWLDERRPLTTELYVIGADYVPIGVRPPSNWSIPTQREAVLNTVTAAIRLHLWALPPGGPDGRAGRSAAPSTTAHRDGDRPRAGRATVAPGAPVRRAAGDPRWRLVGEDATGRARLPLLRGRCPELLMLGVDEGDSASTGCGRARTTRPAVAVPVVPEVC